MTFSSSRYKREAGKSTVVKCLHLVLSNKFINTSPSFYFKFKLSKMLSFTSIKQHSEYIFQRTMLETLSIEDKLLS